ncbi:MAG: hypothetical protein IT176_04295 [Acidobacteria bacterium]|nr:hypothetical protein [Acidobacteriota bacterium]
MGTRIGIELAPGECRIVEIEAPAGRDAGAGTRIRATSVSPAGSGETRRRLAQLRGREAAVVAWGLRGDHRQAIVDAGPCDAMRREAVQSLRSAGIETRGMLVDIAPAGPRLNDARRPVLAALASRADLAEALRPLTLAGIRVRSVVAPGAALASVARLRRGRGALPGIEAYVSLEEQATCMALVRGHVLVGARELPRGYVHENEPFGERVPRAKVAARLAADLRELFSTAGLEPASVGVVCLCGTLPELRSMSMLMMEQLEVEIEPLDSMSGVDAGEESEASRDFRERGIELRLAWAAAADWRAPLNLLRERQRRIAAARFAAAAVAAGVGFGMAIGWTARQSPWLRPESIGRASADRAPAQRRGGTAPMAGATIAPAAAARGTTTIGPAPALERPPGTSGSGPEPQPTAAAAPPLIRRERSVAAPPAPAPGDRPVVRTIAAPPARAAARTNPPSAMPAATLGSILFSPDRKLAMIDGQIVEAGDDIGGQTVVEIGQTTVTMRDGDGRLRRLSLRVGKP